MRAWAEPTCGRASSREPQLEGKDGAVGEVALGEDLRPSVARDLVEVIRALDEGQAHRERSGAPALLDDDAPADRGARREWLAVDLDAQPHGSTHSGTGSATRFSPTRRTTTAQL